MERMELPDSTLNKYNVEGMRNLKSQISERYLSSFECFTLCNTVVYFEDVDLPISILREINLAKLGLKVRGASIATSCGDPCITHVVISSDKNPEYGKFNKSSTMGVQLHIVSLAWAKACIELNVFENEQEYRVRPI